MTLLDYFRRLLGGDGHSKPDVTNEELTDDNIDPFNPFPEPIRIDITDVIDLHTIQPREVKRVVEEYLEQVHEVGFQTVRIIHGKGIGVQREIVHSVLAKTSFVDTWTDAPPDAGGWGATIVKLNSNLKVGHE